MAPVDVPVALLGYGTVGAAVNRFLHENADEIERATGHRLRVVRALVRDLKKERDFPAAAGVLTTDFAEISGDPEIAVVAEVMGGLEPTSDYILRLLRSGRPVVTANKQLLAQRGAELFAAAQEGGVQLRFEASVCAAIPVIKVLREALVVTNVHRILGIVNGTTNYILTQMELGAEYEEALADAKRQGYAEMDPTEDVSGADAAAKMAILATVAFGSRVTLEDVNFEGVERITSAHVGAAKQMDMVVRLVGRATLVEDGYDVRVSPALIDRAHPRRDPRDHARRARRRRNRDRLGRDRRHGLDHRHQGHRLSPQRRLLAQARPASGRRAALALLPSDLGGRSAGRAGSCRRAPGGPRRLGRAPRPVADRRRCHPPRHLARGDLRSCRHGPGRDKRPSGES